MEGKRTAQRAHSLQAEIDDGGLVLAGHSAWEAADPRVAHIERFFLHAPAGMLELDAEARLLRVNPAFCRMTGYLTEELVGRSLSEFVASPEEVERLRDLLYAGAGAGRFELELVRHEGALLRARVTAAVAPADMRQPPTLIALVEDADPAAPLVVDADEDARVDAIEAVAGAVAQARDAAYDKGVGIAFAYTTDPVWVNIDSAQLREALDDLIDRTVRSGPVGSVAVRCRADAADAVFELVATSDSDAAGIDLLSAFDIAAHTDSGITEPRDFTNLGAMFTLVQAHSGDIELSESPSRGRRVTVRLPLA